MQIKPKTLVSWSSQKKKECIFLTFILSEGNFFNFWILSQCMVYWINFQNIYFSGVDPEIFKRGERGWGGALYVSHHGVPAKKNIDFRWSKKGKTTLETISFWQNISISILKFFFIFIDKILSIFQNLLTLWRRFFDDTIIPTTNTILSIKNDLKHIIQSHYKQHTVNNTLEEFKINFCINNTLCTLNNDSLTILL